MTNSPSFINTALFFLAFCLGAFLIVTVKWMGFSQIVVTIFPVLILLVYAFTLTFVDSMKISGDRAGDACYYLGFLFTLVSLSTALYEFSASSINVEPLVANFGIALATTMVGLILRVGFVQLSSDMAFDGYIDEAHAELTHTVEKLRAVLNNSVTKFNVFEKEIHKRLNDNSKTFGEEQAKFLRNCSETLGSNLKLSSDRISDVATAMESESNCIKTSSQQLVDRIEKITSHFNGLDIPKKIVDEEIAPISRLLSELSESLMASVSAEKEHFQSLQKLVSDSHGGITDLREQIAELGDTRETVQDLNKQLSKAGVAAESFCVSLKKTKEEEEKIWSSLREKKEETETILNDHNAAVRRHLEKERDLVRRMEDGLVEATDRLTAQIKVANSTVLDPQ